MYSIPSVVPLSSKVVEIYQQKLPTYAQTEVVSDVRVLAMATREVEAPSVENIARTGWSLHRVNSSSVYLKAPDSLVANFPVYEDASYVVRLAVIELNRLLSRGAIEEQPLLFIEKESELLLVHADDLALAAMQKKLISEEVVALSEFNESAIGLLVSCYSQYNNEKMLIVGGPTADRPYVQWQLLRKDEDVLVPFPALQVLAPKADTLKVSPAQLELIQFRQKSSSELAALFDVEHIDAYMRERPTVSACVSLTESPFFDEVFLDLYLSIVGKLEVVLYQPVGVDPAGRELGRDYLRMPESPLLEDASGQLLEVGAARYSVQLRKLKAKYELKIWKISTRFSRVEPEVWWLKANTLEEALTFLEELMDLNAMRVCSGVTASNLKAPLTLKQLTNLYMRHMINPRND